MTDLTDPESVKRAYAAVAAETLARHVYFKDFLMAAGVEENVAEDEACAMEHMISADTFRKLMEKYPIG